ncbi:hypothetical protein SERLA73DRAFT_159669 [Serpula lacrymans var. lacrymans S7.3]|uniref:Carboxylic ester hydrolase n=2 Tax=Serpula lacrymans var. lacrymans TaxID=341189 RepID=F8PRT7_SERL3|nr:uncharacterized protein SERLADRAFT_414696 [Serpula lacrymans var. lacrymans S7.9]EGO01172.1 hypothetical protein SERLA73DRAFT_159669 [Serpula lacrymans var. lacrymans S7.3]EGO26821.1 hypothetical protein SERLADRAFT_414696 [Serpula lacrymans var. lacrymans S7.9]
MALSALSLIAFATSIWAANLTSPTPPTVTLDYGSFQGFSSVPGTESFLGMPYAQPPIGNLRFNHPIHPLPFNGTKQATAFGNSCPQQPYLGPNSSLPDNPGLSGVELYLGEFQPQPRVNASEDCLFINVVRPAGVTQDSNLPVIVWLYGGAFESGDSSSTNGTDIVGRSLDLKTPVIQVSLNYRMNAFGFLAGKEVKAAGVGNIGLYDQRLALEWIQKYVARFGGDPSKVIVWGQSSGSISALAQMVAFDGQLDGLFAGAVMESGTATPIGDISYGQTNYDIIVAAANCTSAEDTLGCLRAAPYEAILDGVLATAPLLSYQSLDTSWHPMVDGVILKRSIRQSLAAGTYARVPVIASDVDDEGTLFSLYSFNVTTDQDFLDYLSSTFLAGAEQYQIDLVGWFYPADPAEGSPFQTGSNDTLGPQYKRIAAFQGDFYFQVPRRYTLSHLSKTQNVWSYIWKRYKYVPGIGSFHESDLGEYYKLTNSSDFVGVDALVNFAYHLDPNVPAGGQAKGAATSVLSGITWPRYRPEFGSAGKVLSFWDPNVLNVTRDDFRTGAMDYLDWIQDEMGL